MADNGTLEFDSAGAPLAEYGARWLRARLGCARHRWLSRRTGILPRLRHARRKAAGVSARRIRRGGEVGAPHARIPQQKRRKDRMHLLNDMEIGVMFWAGRDPYETIREMKSWGVRCGQMGIPGDMPLEGAAALWKQALADEDFTVVTVFAAYAGESYADIPTVQQTVGFVPPATRAERELRTVGRQRFRRRNRRAGHRHAYRLRPGGRRLRRIIWPCSKWCAASATTPPGTARPSRSKPARSPRPCCASSCWPRIAPISASTSTRPI